MVYLMSGGEQNAASTKCDVGRVVLTVVRRLRHGGGRKCYLKCNQNAASARLAHGSPTVEPRRGPQIDQNAASARFDSR